MSLVIAVVLPLVTRNAIDLALVDRTEPLAKYLWILLALGLVRAVLTYGYRSSLSTGSPTTWSTTCARRCSGT